MIASQLRLGLEILRFPGQKIFSIGGRIAAGMKILDDLGPPDWRTRLRLDRLNIMSRSNCILGQLYDDYRIGCSELGINHSREAAEYGFTTMFTAESSDDLQKREFEALTRGWRLAIRNPQILPERIKIAA